MGRIIAILRRNHYKFKMMAVSSSKYWNPFDDETPLALSLNVVILRLH